jgi:hypothetical protein
MGEALDDFLDDMEMAEYQDGDLRMHTEVEDVLVKSETEKALLCIIEGEQMWIPKSQITDDSEVWKQGDEGTLVITEWLAEQKGLL